MSFNLNTSIQRGIDVDPLNRNSHITANNFEILLGDSYGSTTLDVLNKTNTPIVSIRSDGYLGVLGKFSINGLNIINTPYITLSDAITNNSSSIFLTNINPNGAITGTKSSISLNAQDGYIYSNFDGASTWKRYATIDEVQHAGGGNSTQKLVEIDVGSASVYEYTAVINDPDVTTNSNISVSVSGITPTGKDADEITMDSFATFAWPDTTNNGIFYIYIRGLEGYIEGKFKMVYALGI